MGGVALAASVGALSDMVRDRLEQLLENIYDVATPERKRVAIKSVMSPLVEGNSCYCEGVTYKYIYTLFLCTYVLFLFHICIYIYVIYVFCLYIRIHTNKQTKKYINIIMSR